MVLPQAAAIFGYFPDEGIALLVIVMEVHFHVADAQAHYFCYAVEQCATVLLLRIEEAVLRALPCRVSGSVVGNARPAIAPLCHAAQCGFYRSAHAERLVVIGDGNPRTRRLLRRHTLPKAVLQIRHKPDFRVSRELH